MSDTLPYCHAVATAGSERLDACLGGGDIPLVFSPGPRVLILGGTGEGAALARALDGRARVTSSLAGRTRRPAALAGAVRTGGFGGAAGLARYLREKGVERLIDATHPFAARISANAREAAERVGVPRLAVERPMWRRRPGDRWICVADAAEAARSLAGLPDAVFLTLGPGDLEAFADLADRRFILRRIDPGPSPLPDATVVLARGPFDFPGERRLFEDYGVGTLVTRASGGAATEAKILAARECDMPVVMIRRPPPEPGPRVSSVEEAVAWALSSAGSGSS